MRQKLIVFTILAIICMFTGASAFPAVYGGRVAVEGKEVTNGSSFIVKLYLTGNDVGLTSLRVPLEFDGTYLTCTYVDFSGSLKDAQMTGSYTISSDGVVISYIPPVVNPLPTIDADSGLIASLYFSVDDLAPDITITIDSLNRDTEFSMFGNTFHQWNRAEMTADDGSGSLAPEFTAGDIIVRRPTGVDDDKSILLPGKFKLTQNYPNPFNPNTIIGFTLPERAFVRLEVFNVLGQNVAILANEDYAAGAHQVEWDASDSPSGIYFYRISSKDGSFTKKMLLLK